jgi:cytochrome c5
MRDCQWYNSSQVVAAQAKIHASNLRAAASATTHDCQVCHDADMTGNLLLLLTTHAVPVLKLIAAMPAMGARTVYNDLLLTAYETYASATHHTHQRR